MGISVLFEGVGRLVGELCKPSRPPVSSASTQSHTPHGTYESSSKREERTDISPLEKAERLWEGRWGQCEVFVSMWTKGFAVSGDVCLPDPVDHVFLCPGSGAPDQTAPRRLMGEVSEGPWRTVVLLTLGCHRNSLCVSLVSGGKWQRASTDLFFLLVFFFFTLNFYVGKHKIKGVSI